MIHSIPTKGEVLAYLWDLQALLNLKHWRVELSSRGADQGCLFQVVTTRARNHASVRASEEGLHHPEWKRLLKHELIHLIVDPIREEHDFQMEALQTERHKEYSSRHLRELEKVVEHLSYVL